MRIIVKNEYTHDKGKVKVAFQIPLYPMIDCEDTDSSRDNHGNIHAFDMLCPWLKRSRVAKRRLCKAYEKVIQRIE